MNYMVKKVSCLKPKLEQNNSIRTLPSSSILVRLISCKVFTNSGFKVFLFYVVFSKTMDITLFVFAFKQYRSVASGCFHKARRF
jgi:hypothetical protein